MTTITPVETLQNHHGTMIELSGHGVLVEGKSGAGKTSLALGLIEHFERNGKPAILISDDQIFLEAVDQQSQHRLIAHRPLEIANKVEIRGFGIVKMASKSKSSVDLIVQLVCEEEIERMPDEQFEERLGGRIPIVKVPAQHEAQSIRIVLAKMTELFD